MKRFILEFLFEKNWSVFQILYFYGIIELINQYNAWMILLVIPAAIVQIFFERKI